MIKKIPNSRPWSKQREQNLALCESPTRFNLYPTSEKNGSKTIPFSIHNITAYTRGNPHPFFPLNRKQQLWQYNYARKHYTYSRLEISNSELSNISETTIIRNIPKKKEEEYAKILKKDLGGCLWSFFADNILKIFWMNKNVLCT